MELLLLLFIYFLEHLVGYMMTELSFLGELSL